jgi:hypothetical protein
MGIPSYEMSSSQFLVNVLDVFLTKEHADIPKCTASQYGQHMQLFLVALSGSTMQYFFFSKF